MEGSRPGFLRSGVTEAVLKAVEDNTMGQGGIEESGEIGTEDREA